MTADYATRPKAIEAWNRGLTMAEYLDKEAFKKSVEERYCEPCKTEEKDYNGCLCRACWVDDMLDEVECSQSADVAPVVHGRWEIVVGSNGNEYMVCTCCRVSQDLTGVFTYCPNCGAKMDGGAE